MALCVRRLVLAATLAAVVALLLCTSSAPVARAAGTGDFTAAQRTNTLKVLQAFGRAIPDLGKKWTSDNFCAWEFIVCEVTGVSVSGISATYAGSLPEMPAGVDYTNVVIKQLDFSEIGLGLVGTLPDSWSKLQGLTALTFSGNNVSGTLPASWKSMGLLTELWIEDCGSISGSLPPQWSSMSNLTTLLLRHLQLSGTLPGEWAAMSSLNTLEMTAAGSITGTLPPEWSSMKSLTSLFVNESQISGTLPQQWSSMNGLIILGLMRTQVSGTLPAAWSSMKSLTTLNLQRTNLYGTLPPQWSSMTSLSFLYLRRTRVSGTLPPQWSSMTSLTLLVMQATQVSGSLPPQWSSMKSLTLLSLRRTQVSGTLPPQWSSMKSLTLLALHYTKVSGTLPPQWSSMKSLTTLALQHTQVSGSLPPQWSSMTSLNLLHLHYTKVSGTLPREWSMMTSAEVLQLEYCNLSGSLPPEWSAMPKLASVSLRGNHFCGCVPDSWVKKAGLAVDIEDEHKGSNCHAATPTPARETECEADGCELCREGYFLTSEKTCRADRDGGVVAGRRDSTHRWSCALCCEALVSVPSLPCRCNRAATTAATLPRRTVPPDADAGPAELTSAAAASCRDAEACATTGDADALLLPAPRLDRPAVGWAPLPWRRAMGAGVVRLPHHRHGRALPCFVVRDPVACAVARPRTPTLPCPAYASSPLLWEVRAHAPPSGFARSWLVKGRAVPSTVGAGELLAATPLDLTFSALHELLGDAQRCYRVARTFMPAAGLHRAGGMAFSARATATAAGCEAAAPVRVCAADGELSAWSGADDTHVGCGGPHGWTADPRSRPAAPSMCSATPHGWAGWARAAAARPLLLRGCVGVPESDGVLRRLCEAREVGGSVSAQTASCDAPADSRHGVHHRPSESVAYVPVRLHAALAVACGLADPAAAPACSPTAAA
ncbi:hypothetical protein CGC20_0955 [Leishmania donovani]|uniref:non-specific serine/threonine protein kinase n=1 Tax=Leishmania donovani TaxID=5661 RepID=A0A504XUS4_LEIDO|nr:hypothetical protein CGC20_0955 [Leishmania donovani]